MLSGSKLKMYREDREMSVDDLAQALMPANLADDKAELKRKETCSMIRNWERGLLRPRPQMPQIDRLAQALSVERNDLLVWTASHRFCPMTPRKVRLVANLIRGRDVQDALDVLKFSNKRAAVMVEKVLRSAIANADENEADVERLYISDARVDEGGIRPGTRRWRPKDRGRAVPFTRQSSHIHIAVDMI